MKEKKDLVISLNLQRKEDNYLNSMDFIIPSDVLINKTRNEIRETFRKEAYRALDTILKKNINKYLNL